MQYVLGTIDTVYEWVIYVTLYVVNGCVSLYSPVVAVKRENEIIEESREDESPTISKTSTFHAVRDVLGKYDRIMRKRTDPESVGGVVPLDLPVAEKNTIMYADAPRVPIYKNPTIEFDAQIGEIPYAEMIIVLEPRGRFYRVVWETLEGWVLKEDIADRAVRVYPEFTIGEENAVDHPNTAQVRTLLDDVFGLRRSEFALQAGEYVLYRLWRKGIHIDWPEIRPRVPGVWHKILKGVPKIHIGVLPKQGAIMEYMMSPEMGHLAYVEAIFPDDTITISEVNFPDSGIYNERVLTKEEWKEMHPLFIEVTA